MNFAPCVFLLLVNIAPCVFLLLHPVLEDYRASLTHAGCVSVAAFLFFFPGFPSLPGLIPVDIVPVDYILFVPAIKPNFWCSLVIFFLSFIDLSQAFIASFPCLLHINPWVSLHFLSGLLHVYYFLGFFKGLGHSYPVCFFPTQ